MVESQHLFKRYSGRRLFDTVNKCYVTLQDIHALVAQGETVCVLEKGQDITGRVLLKATAEAAENGRSRIEKPLYTSALLSLIQTVDKLYLTEGSS